MSDPRVSVVMPVRNGAAYVVEAVRSVLDQSLRELEVVVVDDGSTDETPELLRTISREDERVRVVVQEPRGLTHALNHGWRSSRAPYIARLDSDDVALPNRLEAQVRFLETHPRVAVVGSAYFPLALDGSRLPLVRYPTDDASLRRELRRSNCLPHPTVMIRRSALEEARGYRLDQAEDYDLWLRISERHQLANLPEPLTLYRHHAGQFSVKKLERQTLGAVAVRQAAKFREHGLPDPLDNVSELDPSLLESLGVTEEEFARAVEADRLTWAGVLAEVGDEDGALRMLAGGDGVRPSQRDFIALSRLYRGRTAYRAGRPASAVKLIAAAAAANPQLVFRAGMRRLTRAGGGLAPRG